MRSVSGLYQLLSAPLRQQIASDVATAVEVRTSMQCGIMIPCSSW